MSAGVVLAGGLAAFGIVASVVIGWSLRRLRWSGYTVAFTIGLKLTPPRPASSGSATATAAGPAPSGAGS